MIYERDPERIYASSFETVRREADLRAMPPDVAELAVRVAQSLRAEPDSVDFRRKVAELTPRQREVLSLIAQGKSSKDIADALFLSEGTAKNHVTKILQTLQVPDRTKLALMLVRHNVEL